MASLTSVPGKAIEQILLKTICKHMKAKTMMGSSHHRFMTGKLCLTSLTSFYDKTGRAVKGEQRMWFLLISERISTPFHPHGQIYLSWAKREKGRWTDNCLTCHAQRDVTSNTEPSWRPVTSGVKLGGVVDTQDRHATAQKA